MSDFQRPQIKICGTTSIEDALLAQDSGADFLGIVVEHAPSPRSVFLSKAQEIAQSVTIPIVIVTVNRDKTWLSEAQQLLNAHALQLHGDESPDLVRELKAQNIEVWTAISGNDAHDRARQMLDAGSDSLLIDARSHNQNGVIYGGTGLRGDWELARELVLSGARMILAGGLDAENVRAAIDFVRPWMIDVVSGVEKSKGVKDAAKVRAFVDAVKAGS